MIDTIRRRGQVSGVAMFLVGCSILMAATALGVRFARLQISQDAKSVLHIDQRHLDFGEVWEQSRFDWKLPVSNCSEKRIRISRIAADCRCTHVVPEALELQPGETQNLRVTLDLTRKAPSTKGNISVRPFETTLRLFVADRIPKAQICTLRGRVRENPISVVPPRLDFGNELVVGGAAKSYSAILKLRNADAASDVRASVHPKSMGSALIVPVEDQSSQYQLHIQPAQSLKPGSFSFRVRVRAIYESVETNPFCEVPVTGTIVQEPVAIPDEVRFGLHPVGTGVHESLVLRSRTGRRFSVEKILCSGMELRVRRLRDIDSQRGSIPFRISTTVSKSNGT